VDFAAGGVRGLGVSIWDYQKSRSKALQIGGIEDHVHLLLAMPATLALSN
jgi:hypothetical protein